MLAPDPSFSAFIATSNPSANDLPPVDDDEEFWEMFFELALAHKTVFIECLDDTLCTLLLFAALFSAVNVGILGLSLPTLAIGGTGQPTKYSMDANRIFASSLTCSLLAAFFSLVGKQWLTHYKKLGPTAHLENRRTLQRQLDGIIRWRFEGSVEVVLTTVLQVALILFLLGWVPYLHWQGKRVSYPVDGTSNFGAILLVLMLSCASWDRWCPFQTPYTTTIPHAMWTSVLHCRNICPYFLQTVTTIRQTISGLRSDPSKLLRIFRRLEDTDEVMDIKSLCWMLEHAPRGRPLLRVAQHVSSILHCRSKVAHCKRIKASHHLFRLHETFWYLIMKIKWLSRGNPGNANDNVEILEQLSIIGKAVICTSPQWTEGPLLPSIMKDSLKVSFDTYGPKNGTRWEEVYPFLKLQVSYMNDGRYVKYHYDFS